MATVTLLILFLLLNPFGGAAADQAPPSNRLKTLRSLAKVDDFPLFKMRFYGDYTLPGYAAGSGSPRDVRNRNFNVDFSGGPPLHYFIADRSKSVVVELVDGKISELRSPRPWQVATNFVITGLSPENARASCWRYDKVWKTLENGFKTFSASAALSLLKDVSQPNTIWSSVYDIQSLSFFVVMGQKYDRVHEFNLKRPF